MKKNLFLPYILVLIVTLLACQKNEKKSEHIFQDGSVQKNNFTMSKSEAIDILRNSNNTDSLSYAYYRISLAHYMDDNCDSVLMNARKAKQLLGEDSLSILLVKINDIIAKYYYCNIESEKCIHQAFLLLSQATSIKHKYYQAEAMILLGGSFIEIHKYSEAYLYLTRSIKISEEFGYYDKLIEANNLMGLLHSANFNTQKATDYFHRSLHYALKNNDSTEISVAFHNIATSHLESPEYLDSTIYYLKKSTLFSQSTNKEELMITWGMIASAYLENDRLDSAVSYINKMLLKIQSVTSPDIDFLINNLQGYYAFKTKDYISSINFYRHNINNLDTLDYQDIKTYYLLANSYLKSGKNDSAYYFYNRYANAIASIRNAENKTPVISKALEEKIDREKEEFITGMKTINLLKKQKRNAIYFIITSILLIITLIWYYFNIRKKNRVISQKNKFHLKLLEKSKDIIIIVNKQGEITYRSPSYESILKLPYAQNQTLRNFPNFHPEDVKEINLLFIKFLRSEENSSFDFEFRIKNGLGEYRLMQASATVLWNAPLIQGTIINFRDITIEKERENKIIESEKTFRNIFNGVSDAIFLLNKDRKFITVNEGAVKMFQYDKELFINNTPEFLSAPNKNDFPKVNQCISDTFDGKSSSIIFWGKRKNNEIFPKIVTFNPSSYFGEQVCLVSAIDITERMKYENLLKANEQKLRAYLENTLAGIISINSNGNIQFCNNAFIQMLEFGGNTEIAGIKFQNLLHPDDKSKYSSASTSFNDIRLLTKSGKYIWVRMTQSKIDIPNEEIQYVLVFINVDNEIKYRNELSQNFNMLQAVMNNVPVPIFYKDLDSTILDCNISIQEYFNAPKEAIVGKKVEELLAVDPIHKEKDEEVKKKSYVSYTFQFKDREFIIHKSALRNKTDEIIAIIVSMIDITDIKQKNEELKLLSDTQSKILSLIAHDFRSIIATQKSLTDFILSDNMSYDEIIELQKSMKPSIDSTFNMIDNILIWAQSQQGRIQFSPERILLYPIIEESIKSLQMYAHIKGITILQNIPHDIMGYFDKNQLNAIIQNLLTNALKFTNPQGRVEIHAKEENNEIQIKITDTGIGMTNETIDSILNKHFIFSERGTENEKGSGLGMQIISDFIKAHQGQLLIESKPDKGSTIRVIFPVSRNEHS